jgi:hypothetical protein
VRAPTAACKSKLKHASTVASKSTCANNGKLEHALGMACAQREAHSSMCAKDRTASSSSARACARQQLEMLDARAHVLPAAQDARCCSTAASSIHPWELARGNAPSA